MSTELPAGSPGRSSAEPSAGSAAGSTGRRLAAERASLAEERRMRRYRRASLATVLVLALTAGVLGAAAVLRGPHLDSAAINAATAIQRPGQRLVLQADQAIGEVTASDVSVTPEAPFELDPDTDPSTGALTVTFTGMLQYGTEYSVRVDDVVGTTTGLSGSLDYSFETPDATVHTLLRRGGAAAVDKPTDQVLASGLSVGSGSDAGSGSEVIFEAPRIQEFAVAGDVTVAIVLDEQGTGSLALKVGDSAVEGVHTPVGGRLQNLRASTSAGLFGVTVNGGADASGREYQNALFVFDPQTGSGRAEEVLGFGGEPLRVVDWQFVPGTSSIVAQGVDQQLYLLDPLAGGEPSALGRHAEMRGFLPGGVTLVVADAAGTSTIDLTTGDVQPLPLASATVDPALYPGTIVALPDGGSIRRFDSIDYSQAQAVQSSLLLIADASGTRELYRSPVEGTRVRDFCLSPNGQYLAVETIAAGSLSDGYALPGYSDMTTSFVDIATGAATRSVPGFLPDWCT
ncbi:hypothetical protein [Herbiconiux liukaitaii]|uniref:hypothetical protein n=1 Tax=Herbiconiux liukaitaii TaxID=3342799 RepID=UPI0035B7F71F